MERYRLLVNRLLFKRMVAVTCGAATLALGGIAVANAAEPFDTTQSPLKPLTQAVDKADNGNYVSFLDAYNAGASQRNDGGYDDNIIINEHTKHKYYVVHTLVDMSALGGNATIIGVFDYDTGRIVPCSDISIAQNPYTNNTTLTDIGSNMHGNNSATCVFSEKQSPTDFIIKVAGEDQPIAKITTKSIQPKEFKHISWLHWLTADDKPIDNPIVTPTSDNMYKPAVTIWGEDSSNFPDSINMKYYRDALDTNPIPVTFIKDGQAAKNETGADSVSDAGEEEVVYALDPKFNELLNQATTGAHFTIGDNPSIQNLPRYGFPIGMFKKNHITSAAVYVDHSETIDKPVSQEKPAISGNTIYGHAILFNDANAGDTEETSLRQPHAQSVLPSTLRFTFISDDDCSANATPEHGLTRSGLYSQAFTMNSVTSSESHLKMQVSLAQPDTPNPYYDQYYVGATASVHGGYEPDIKAQSDDLTIKPPVLNSEKQTVKKNATLQATDGVTSLPLACTYKATVTKPADTSKAGETSQTDNIHFVDGSDQTVTVPVTVTGDESDSYSDSNITTVTVKRGGTVHDKDGLGSLPSNATVHVDTPADTSKIGSTKQVVTIHFSDGSSKQVTVPVTVQGNDADSAGITTSNVTVHKGDTVDKSTGLSGVPQDATISVDTPADTTHAGSTQQTVTVHFKDGSTKQYTVNITVKDKIPASMITPVPSYDVHANVSTATVSRGGTLKPTDGLKNIPDGANVTMVTPADTSHTGSSKQVVKMTFKDGSSMLITVPVNVQPTAADSYGDDNVKPVTVLRGGMVHDKDGLSNLPQDATVHVDTPADTSHAGKTQQVVTIHFKDGSSKQVTVNITVQPTAADNYSDSNIKPVTAYKGDAIKPTDGLGNLPEGAKATVVTPADTSKPGETQQVVNITFTDGSSKQVTVNVTVKDKTMASMIIPVPEYDAKNVTLVTAHTGDKLKATDGLNNLPEGATVIIRVPADTSKPGSTKQIVNVTFKDGSSRVVTVPVTVKDTTAMSMITPVPEYDTSMNVTKVTAHTGDKLTATAGLKNLPDGAKVTVITPADTSKPGDSKQVVKITFKDGSSRVVTIPVTVKDKAAWASVMPVPEYNARNISTVTVHVGDTLKPTDGLSNLPDDAKVTLVTPADTSKPGDSKQVVKITFKDGSSRVVTVPVAVKAKVTPASQPAQQPMPYANNGSKPMLAMTGANTIIITTITLLTIALAAGSMIVKRDRVLAHSVQPAETHRHQQ